MSVAPTKARGEAPVRTSLRALADQCAVEEAQLREGGGKKGQERQHRLGRLLVRERIKLLKDEDADFFEMGLWQGYRLYEDCGDLPAAGVVAGITDICKRPCMIIGNDATVKAGAFFPQSVKKVLRAQRMAYELKIPVIYLVDSSGVYLPMQDEIFPDEDDFGRIFRNNSLLSAAGLPQFAAVMGNCIAGGSYLPALCDKILMTEGSGLYLAGPALVKAAIGQEVDTEELGGAAMHAELSGTVDFYEPDDPHCLKRVRALVDMLPAPKEPRISYVEETEFPADKVYEWVSGDNSRPYEVRDVLKCFIDKGSLQEFRADWGQTLVCAYAKMGGQAVGIVANQGKPVQSKAGGIEIGGVIYAEAADKAARFIMDCNQIKVPLLFFQNVVGFMVGRDAEQSGIIRRGAKLVNAMSNTVVPKITIVIGNSFGAGNYALCGKAYDPSFILAWPNAKYAVMGADQAASTLLTVQSKAAERHGNPLGDEELQKMYEKLRERYREMTDIRYGAARGWVDSLIAPHETRSTLLKCLHLLESWPYEEKCFHTGVIQT